MTQTIKQVGTHVLNQLERFNRQVWDAVSFGLIHATMSKEKELQGSSAKTKEYRSERWKKAISKTKGDRKKAYELLASEDFY